MPESTTASLGPVRPLVDSALASLDADNVIERVWQQDSTVWSKDPTEITQPNRLGWLDIASTMLPRTKDLIDFADGVAGEGYTTAVLFGMGGSSLAPEVLQNTIATRPGMLHLHVLDTTHPDSILGLKNTLDLEHTLFIVASKSGATVETLSQFAYFWELLPHGAHYIAITDSGSHLHSLGEERHFRRVFLNPPELGGRYSALSYFGLVPGALVGADPEAILLRAKGMEKACEARAAASNPGAYLGATMGEAVLSGRDKLTLVLPDEIASYGDWVEQLLAESTGKEGKGIIPIVGEPLAHAGAYGDDRLFVALGNHPNLAAIEAAGHPVLRLPYEGPEQLGSEFFRWEFATAIAGQRFQINPFNQPNVQSAKDATARILESGSLDAPQTPSLSDLLAGVKPGDYIALLAYLPRDTVMQRELQALRLELRDRYLVATTMGFGPRYLHSTGQLHKGGPNSGVFLLITDNALEDVAIPGQSYSFDKLRHAQAIGDLQSLQAMGRRVAHIHLEGDRIEALQALRRGIS